MAGDRQQAVSAVHSLGNPGKSVEMGYKWGSREGVRPDCDIEAKCPETDI